MAGSRRCAPSPLLPVAAGQDEDNGRHDGDDGRQHEVRRGVVVVALCKHHNEASGNEHLLPPVVDDDEDALDLDGLPR